LCLSWCYGLCLASNSGLFQSEASVAIGLLTQDKVELDSKKLSPK
jgi:hypothetical protein